MGIVARIRWAAGAAALALLCVLGAGAAPAFADEGFAVALTVVDATDGTVVANTRIGGMTADDTVGDLLGAAGFTQVADQDAWGAQFDYWLEWGSPYFLGKGYDAATGAYWTTIFNGSSNGYADAMADAHLQAGGHYQYVYGAATVPGTYESTFAYSLAVPDPLEADDSMASELARNLALRFSRFGDLGELTNDTFRAAPGVARAYLPEAVDAGAVAAQCTQQAMASGRLAKYVIALTAAGVDCTALTFNGVEYDLVAMMDEGETSPVLFYDAVWMLVAHDFGGYAYAPGASVTEADLVAAIAGQQVEGGANAGQFPLEWSSLQSTAQAIIALAPHADEAGVGEVLDAACATILAAQNEDGGFAYETGGASDIDATAECMVALAALGVPVNGLGGDADPVAYLVHQADDQLDGYEESGVFNAEMTESNALGALACAYGQATAAEEGEGQAASQVSLLYAPVTVAPADLVWFGDVKSGAWYAGVVADAVRAGLFKGEADVDLPTFAPAKSMKRRDVAVVLWRAAGEPTATGPQFADVPENAYYADALRWAREAEVFHGNGGKVNPNGDITRQDLACVLANYAMAHEAGQAGDGTYAQAPDAGSMDAYARTCVDWCYTNKVMTGNDKTGALTPKATANRAMAAKMLLLTVNAVGEAA